MKVKVEVEKKIRIDKYLSSELDLSRSKIQKLIKDELVLVNDKIVSSNYQVKDKDEIEIKDELDYEINIEPEDIDIDVVYEDKDL